MIKDSALPLEIPLYYINGLKRKCFFHFCGFRMFHFYHRA